MQNYLKMLDRHVWKSKRTPTNLIMNEESKEGTNSAALSWHKPDNRKGDQMSFESTLGTSQLSKLRNSAFIHII